jgi:hypothetical protein
MAQIELIKWRVTHILDVDLDLDLDLGQRYWKLELAFEVANGTSDCGTQFNIHWHWRAFEKGGGGTDLSQPSMMDR